MNSPYSISQYPFEYNNPDRIGIVREVDVTGQRIPAVVYLPCVKHVAEAAEASPVMEKLADGELALVVYSDPDLLYAGFGDVHPWLPLRTEELAALLKRQGADRVVLDPLDLHDGDTVRGVSDWNLGQRFYC